jgi:myosin heavy subunit
MCFSFSVDSINFDFPNNRSILDMCLSKPIGLLALLDEESRFPQSTEFTLVNKWRENLNSPHFTASTPSSSLSRKTLKRQKQVSFDIQPLFTIHHYAGNIHYTAKDFLEKNRDYVPMEIIDLLLQSEDHLVNLLFRSRLRKTGSVIYTEQDKTSSFFRSSTHKTATANRTQGTVSTYFRYSLMELVSAMALAQPTFIRCLVPNRLPSKISHITYDHTSYFPHNFTFDSSQFDETVVLEQIRYSGLFETIEIRRHGYSHRIFFDDFISVYSCLIDFKDKSLINNDKKQICELILKKFHFNNYAIGKTKIFLKFHHIEQLNIAYKNFLTKIIRLQSRIRMYLIKKQNRLIKSSTVKTEYEQSITRLQAIARGFLVRRANQKKSTATLTIRAYWRMWYERTRFKRRLLHYHNQQIQISYFFKQVELLGNHLSQQLRNLKEINEYSNQSSINEEKKVNEDQSLPKMITPPKPQTNTKRRVSTLCEYYDKIYKEYLNRKNKKIVEEPKKEIIINTVSQRPSTAPAITNIPQAPPCPPPEFFKQTTTTTTNSEVPPVKRQKSAPARVTTHIDELKQIFAIRS